MILLYSIVGDTEFDNWIKALSIRFTVLFIVLTMIQLSNNFHLMTLALSGDFA